MKNTKGITLIALIITIIVMLILVSVSISTAINTGLFKTASEATKKWGQAQNEEIKAGQDMENYLVNMEISKDVRIKLQKLQIDLSLLEVAFDAMNNHKGEMLALREQVRECVSSNSNINADGVTQVLNSLDDRTNNTSFNGEKLLDGTLNRDVGIEGLTVHIVNLDSTSLGLSLNDNDLTTQDGLKAYIEKIDQANSILSDNVSKIGGALTALNYVEDYYTSKETLIDSNPAHLDKELVKLSLSKIKQSLAREVELIKLLENETADIRRASKYEIETLLIAIDYISNDTTYGDKKLLDGTFENISEINTTTLGGGTKLRTDVTTADSIEEILAQYQNAVKIVENELAKL